jgi:hypothetical protein
LLRRVALVRLLQFAIKNQVGNFQHAVKSFRKASGLLLTSSVVIPRQ